MKHVLLKCNDCNEVLEWAIDAGCAGCGHDHCPNCGGIDSSEPNDEDTEHQLEDCGLKLRSQ